MQSKTMMLLAPVTLVQANKEGADLERGEGEGVVRGHRGREHSTRRLNAVFGLPDKAVEFRQGAVGREGDLLHVSELVAEQRLEGNRGVLAQGLVLANTELVAQAQQGATVTDCLERHESNVVGQSALQQGHGCDVVSDPCVGRRGLSKVEVERGEGPVLESAHTLPDGGGRRHYELVRSADRHAGAFALGVRVGGDTQSLVERFPHSAGVVCQKTTLDHDLHLARVERRATLGAIGQERERGGGVLHHHEGVDRVVVASNRLVDGQVPGGPEVSDAFHRVSPVRVGPQGLLGRQLSCEPRDNLLAHVVIDRDGSHGPLELNMPGLRVQPHNLR
mmetsp:Transcript_21155/g.49605  ORF Transcript_21155/g.49605 Transcript_21155/m.49605 type:complete len:334 (+) Transcript_21155:32-1033(+)